ncbi:tensin-4-like isoform X1 [Pecten maximus]|uniref:tensin-4-like isoform X1 n=2 Tax=Pecten maximus TaxID=6579 RepID=UPI0014585E3D|nr:tensin-4-like isoform X1 [Pecten maximus]
MYLMRSKKHLENQDLKELQDKREKFAERHRDGSSRSSESASVDKSPAKTNKKEEFTLEELPDGACFRPKSVLSNVQDAETAVRPAEYIGSFSVQGADQNARAECVQTHLEDMRTVDKSKKVLLVISLSGIKVCSSNGESVYMAHALKRISYATCDPDHCQFSFLAREPKGHINLQFCHAFITSTSEEAEELNTIIGNAFKMAYAQQRVRQPTFNELIEMQLNEQKAKFAEYQVQAQKEFKQKLTEIATPTPFSEKAIQRMEMRRQSSSDDVQEKELVVGKNKLWFSLQRSPIKAKQAVDKVKHRSAANETLSSSPPGRSESPTVGGRPQSEALIHNYSIGDTANKRNSTPVHSLNQNASSLAFLRSSFDSTNNSGKSKGSPVTALKDAIDKGFCNGSLSSQDSTDSGGLLIHDQEGYLAPHNGRLLNEDKNKNLCNKMVNRPLPALPTQTNGQSGSPCKYKNWTSMDDDVLVPRRSRSRGDNMGDSPKRRPARPLSEVFSDKKLSNFPGARLDEPGCYMYGSREMQTRQIRNSRSEGTQIQQQVHLQTQQFISNHRSPSKQDDHSSPSKQVFRYQNNQSPFQEPGSYESTEDSSQPNKSRPGLESLMGLDRSHIEDETLRHASWYQAGIPREIALEILQQEDIGSFIVRDSSTHPGCYALSVRVPKFENPTGISHYLILKTQRGVKLKGLEKEWPDLIALVTHHTVMSEMLPCTLRLPHKSTNPTFKDSDKDEKEDDPDYQRLSDFSSMMDTLKM